jgi:uncharacterized protein
VNDYAGLLAAGDRARLEQVLAEGEQRTGAQMVVAIFASLEGESLEDVAIRLAERWRIGRKGLDDGVILLVFVEDRRMRLEVGYGLEGVLPDATAGAIVANVIAPRFREGRHAEGLQAAAAEVFEHVGRARGVPGTPARKPGPSPLWILGLAGIFAVIFVVLTREAIQGRRFARRHGYTTHTGGWGVPGPRGPWGRPGGGWGGGGFRGGGGGFGGGGASGRW